MDADVTIRNFRSIREVVFPIRTGLNVVVGANGSGKTNILHALKFLSNIVTSGASLAMAKAGGPTRNFRRGEDAIQFSVETPIDTTLYKGRQALFVFHWSVTVAPSGPDGFVQVKHESFRIDADIDGSVHHVLAMEMARGSGSTVRSKFFLESEEHLTKRLFESSLWVSKSSRKTEIFATIRSKLQEILGDLKKRPLDASLLEQVSNMHMGTRAFFRAIVSLDEYNIAPEVARQAVDPSPVIRMGPDGSGVSDVIGALESDQFRRLLSRSYMSAGSPYYTSYPYDYMWTGRPRKNPLSEVIENLQAAVSSIDSIATEIDPSTGRRFVVFKSGTNKFRPQEMSDGTFKWLCLLVAIFVPTSRVILLEEPENFMHPWMQQRFISLARAQVKANSGSVILSTHSASVLNALTVDELRIAYQVSGETFVEEVLNASEVENLLASSSFGLGDMWVSGEFGGVTGGQ